MTKRSLIAAVNDAIAEEMERDPRVVLFGEDVETSLFGDTAGLSARFGTERVRNTPISETVMTGMAVGAAAVGYRPICHLMYGNFIYTGFDAIANQAAKLRYMTGGQLKLPLVYIASIGGGKSAAAQHSDTIYPVLMNLGGLKVVVPSNPADAKGLMKAAIRDDNPVVFLEVGGRSGRRVEMPEGEHLVDLGRAEIKRSGTDVTLVAIGSMVAHALAASEDLAQQGIEAEVVDPRSLVPLDKAAILGSVRKTGRLVVVDESRDACSAASYIASLVADEAFSALKGPVRRVTVPDVAIPYAPSLEKAVLPDAAAIVAAVSSLLPERSAA